MKLGEVQRVLQMLLREGVPIRQLGPILETLGDCAPRTSDPIALVEHVRRRLARTICRRYRDRDDRLHVVTLDPALEERIRAATSRRATFLMPETNEAINIHLPPAAVEEVCRLIEAEVSKLVAMARPPIVLCSPQVRPALKQLTVAHIPQLVVLSYSEITRETKIESVALVSDSRVNEEVAKAA